MAGRGGTVGVVPGAAGASGPVNQFASLVGLALPEAVNHAAVFHVLKGLDVEMSLAVDGRDDHIAMPPASFRKTGAARQIERKSSQHCELLNGSRGSRPDCGPADYA